jgi:hypothetical protein
VIDIWCGDGGWLCTHVCEEGGVMCRGVLCGVLCCGVVHCDGVVVRDGG